ncbi:DUF308 domain-containing protein [Actinocatenispora sera]|uniref:HdeD family acid-resistance protein n=1 Tax=Actinocatenispora sera TaxID=390989 RepID=UPI0033F6599F
MQRNRQRREAVGPWWLFLVTGIAWALLALAVLQFSLASVAAIAVLFGVVLLAAGLNEFLVAALHRHWRWVHVALGVLFVAGAVAAFVWPGPTFVALSRILAWFLLFKGVFDVIDSLAVRVELWWLRLIAGALEIALAFWAVSYTGRSALLLVAWVGIGAMMRGITEIVFAFDVRAALTAGTPVPESPQQQPSWPVNRPPAGTRPTGHTAADQPLPGNENRPEQHPTP